MTGLAHGVAENLLAPHVGLGLVDPAVVARVLLTNQKRLSKSRDYKKSANQGAYLSCLEGIAGAAGYAGGASITMPSTSWNL
jgi:hypothetical protein